MKRQIIDMPRHPEIPTSDGTPVLFFDEKTREYHRTTIAEILRSRITSYTELSVTSTPNVRVWLDNEEVTSRAVWAKAPLVASVVGNGEVEMYTTWPATINPQGDAPLTERKSGKVYWMPK